MARATRPRQCKTTLPRFGGTAIVSLSSPDTCAVLRIATSMFRGFFFTGEVFYTQPTTTRNNKTNHIPGIRKRVTPCHLASAFYFYRNRASTRIARSGYEPRRRTCPFSALAREARSVPVALHNINEAALKPYGAFAPSSLPTKRSAPNIHQERHYVSAL